MVEQLINGIEQNEEAKQLFKDLLQEQKVVSKTVLLKEGKISDTIYFIKRGCLRTWFNKDGKDITFQLFFEGQPVASIDSFINKAPSLFTIESIEPTVMYAISKSDFDQLLHQHPKLKDQFQDFIFQRLQNYEQLFLSRIKDTPQERYADLLKNHPEFIQRVPQHYIASFLGITPISLSRIRNRLME